MSERSVNKLILVGRTGDNPEVRTTPGGMKLAKVGLATSRTYNDRSGQQQEKTEWHRLTFWDKLADIAERYITKGDRLYIEGRVEYSQTQDDQGNVKYWTDIHVRELVMLGSTGNGNGPNANTESQRNAAPASQGGYRQTSDGPGF